MYALSDTSSTRMLPYLMGHTVYEFRSANLATQHCKNGAKIVYLSIIVHDITFFVSFLFLKYIKNNFRFPTFAHQLDI